MGREFKKPDHIIYVCNGPKCKKRGGKELRKLFEHLADRKSSLKVEVIKTGCTDRCKFAPVVSFQPANDWFPCMNEATAQEEFQKHFSD